jgi:HAD superfamily hydrolase (TIGR01484 family)
VVKPRHSPAPTGGIFPTDLPFARTDFRALATDYDATLADDGCVAPHVLDGLAQLKASRRALVLVTGRELADLQSVCPALDLFDRIVAENGGTLYNPRDASETLLASQSGALVARLRHLGVTPLSIGRVVVATLASQRPLVEHAIETLSIDANVILNRESLMILPPGVDKLTGLHHALGELAIRLDQTIGFGDAENDGVFLRACGCAVAVANAIPHLKQHANIVTTNACGEGVLEVIQLLLERDRPDNPASTRRST